jgi:hypothetical protein
MKQLSITGFAFITLLAFAGAGEAGQLLYTGGHGLDPGNLSAQGGYTHITIGSSDGAWTTALTGGFGAFDAIIVGEGTPVPSAGVIRQ